MLYGALVGGPTDDVTYDPTDRSNFQKNEPADDYNAGFSSAVARMFKEFGGTALASFPPVETPDDVEISVSSDLNQSGANFTEIRSIILNKSAWPARSLKNGMLRYFFTLDGTTTPAQIALTSPFSQCGAPSGPTLWSGSTYYVTVSCAGQDIYPGGQSQSQREMQYRMTSGGTWDTSNDWSFIGLPAGVGAAPVRTNNIVFYNNGVPVWGVEPSANGTPVPTSTPTPTPTATRTAATATPTATRPPATATPTATRPAGTATATATRPPATATLTPTRPAGSATLTSTPRPATATPTATSTAVTGAVCTVTYAIANQWNNNPTSGGFQVNLSITNNGSSTIDGWTLTFAFPTGQTISNLWNATVTQTGANVTVTSTGMFDSIIAPGATMTAVGFTGAWTGSNAKPTAFALNGSACTAN